MSHTLSRLDREILLSEVLQKPRSYLYAWPEKPLTAEQEKLFNEFIQRRQQGEPVAYIVGYQEFWSMKLNVTPDVLIPRPETELLVETVLKLTGAKKIVADLGTGSGAVALAIAHERPEWEIHATDQSEAALKIAKQNQERLKIKNIFFHQGNWCTALPPKSFDVVVSNPPYIANNDPHLERLFFEPQQALVAGEDGLDAIRQIIQQADKHLKPGGMLIIEHGYDQAPSVRQLLNTKGYQAVDSIKDLAGIERVTLGTISC